jgi:hypothetical protein
MIENSSEIGANFKAKFGISSSNVDTDWIQNKKKKW